MQEVNHTFVPLRFEQAHLSDISVMRRSARTRGSSLSACTVARAATLMYLLNLLGGTCIEDAWRTRIKDERRMMKRASQVTSQSRGHSTAPAIVKRDHRFEKQRLKTQKSALSLRRCQRCTAYDKPARDAIVSCFVLCEVLSLVKLRPSSPFCGGQFLDHFRPQAEATMAEQLWARQTRRNIAL